MSPATPTVAVFGLLRFAPEHLDALLPAVRVLVAATRELDGCIAYHVTTDPLEPGLLRFAELWPDRATLDRHMQAPHIGAWREASRACGVLERAFTVYEVGAASLL